MLEITNNWPYEAVPRDGDGTLGAISKHNAADHGTNGVHIVNDNALHTVTGGFYGIYVTTQCIVGNGRFIADLVEGNSPINSTLDPGYHPIAGDQIQMSTAGHAYLLKRQKTNPDV